MAEQAPQPERMTLLPQWHQQLAADYLQAVSNFMPSALRLSAGGSTRLTAGDFLSTHDTLGCCHAIGSAQPLAVDGSQLILVDFTPSVAFSLLENLLGSDGREVSPQRTMTPLELRLMRRMAAPLASLLASLQPPQPEKNLWVVDDSLREALKNESAVAMIVLAFELRINGRVGAMRLALAEPVVQRALAAFGGRTEAVPCRNDMSGPLELTVSVQMDGLSHDELAQLAPGDILLDETNAEGEVTVRVAGIPRYVGRMGTCQGQRAVTIIRKLV